MDTEELVRKYLQNGKVMQLATSVDNQPWCCSVFFVVDKNNCLYWVSKLEHRHSKEIYKNKKTAIAIPIQFDPKSSPVGISSEGYSERVLEQKDIKKIMGLYDKKFGSDENWINKVVSGKSEQKLYKFKPNLFVLHDEINFPDSPRKEWIPKS